MNNSIKLSIIIPIYNVESYLSKCIDSIICQNVDQYEILLIDDGSKDGSGIICDGYGKKYKTIKVFHKENGGLSDARNYGIEHACGEYLMFVDSDDYLEKGSLKQILEKINETNCDVLTAKSYCVDENGIVTDELKYSIKENMYKRDRFFNVLLNNRKSILFCAQYYICRKDLIEKNGLRFKKGIIHEDELWTPQLLLASDSIYYLDSYFYYHLMRTNSIMHSDNDEKSGKSLLIVADELTKVFKGKKKIAFLRDRMAAFYLQAFTKLGLSNISLFSRKLPLKNSFYFNTLLKSLVFFMSPKFYLKLWKRRYDK